jgi:dihydrofolate reductase
MRKVKLQMQVTADGYVSGPNGEMDWMLFNWGDDIKQYVGELTSSMDTILIGRNLYQGMAAHWPAVADNPESDPVDVQAAHAFNNARKILFSTSVENTNWNNTKVTNAPIGEKVAELKQREGKDMILYGGVKLAAGFVNQDLIDEYHFFVNPVMIGQGQSISRLLDKNFALKLVKSQSFACGIVVMHYEPARS